MKLAFTFRLFFSILLLLITCVLRAQTSDSLIRFEKSNFSISYPAGWNLDTTDKRTEFTIFSPKENDKDLFSENVLLVIQDLYDQPMSLDQYAELNITEIKDKAPGLKDFTSEKMNGASGDYYKLTYSMGLGLYYIYTEQFYFVKDNKAYILNFSSQEGNQKELGQRIMNSFRIDLTGRK